MSPWLWTVLVVALLAVLLVAVVFAVRRASFAAPPPAGSVADGRLRPCPDDPNCASTLADPDDDEHHVEALHTGASPERVMAAVDTVLDDLPRSETLARAGSYRHVLLRSRVFAFPDDLEVWFDEPTETLHLRSAARLGRSDLGVNRRRAERVLGEIAARLGADR